MAASVIERRQRRNLEKMSEPTPNPSKIKSKQFYSNYYGHPLEDLRVVHDYFRRDPSKTGLIWLAGDSSFDNKHWFTDTDRACNGYEKFLVPKQSVQDIAYWLNVEAESRSAPYAAINCAVEETTIEDRARGNLVEHDQFIRDNITKDDVLIVSVGGNDIALKPSVCTVCNIVPLLSCTTNSCIEKCVCGTTLPCDDYCRGWTTGCLSNFLAFPCGIGYMMHLFGPRVRAYLDKLTSKVRPKKIIICTIYYPSEKESGGWADYALKLLGYNSNPKKLQTLIKQIFTRATSTIALPDVEVMGVPLFAAMDGKHDEDYCERVEPSAIGGSKMGNLLMNAVIHDSCTTSDIKVDLFESFKMSR
jgi:hypothetical protein